MRSFRSAMATLSVATLCAGLLWPHLAATFLQALVAALAMGYLGARLFRSGLPVALASDAYSPFDAVASQSRPLTNPPAVLHMTALLRAVADPDAADRALIPAEACRILGTEASRRLTERRGLSPLRPGDAERIQAMVSDATWRLVRAAPTGRVGATVPGSIPLSQLENILDDVERL